MLLLTPSVSSIYWQRVAEALLLHSSQPVILASRVPDRRRPARFTWSPAAWRGLVN